MDDLGLKKVKKILDTYNMSYKGLQWCELGNIWYKGSMGNFPTKMYYQNQGVDHTSIDINGKDGALPLDLCFPVPKELLNRFEVITNHGTIEHVNDQYAVFKNVHDMGRDGAVMIHSGPLKGHWPGHCRYYYTTEFYKSLADTMQYEVLYICVDDCCGKNKKDVIAVFRKKDKPFMCCEQFFEIKGLYDSGDTRRTQNYAK